MILFAAIFFISRTLYCYVSINIDMEDCSQPLYFSMHAKEKESEASMKHVGVWAWAWSGRPVPSLFYPQYNRRNCEQSIDIVVCLYFFQQTDAEPGEETMPLKIGELKPALKRTN